MRLCVLVSEWIRESGMWATVSMESPTDHYTNPALYHEYLYWFDGERTNERTKLGWINEEQQSVELFNGTIRAADPEFFEKLRWALNRATQFCSQCISDKLDYQRAHQTKHRMRPWVSAADVINYFGEPHLL